jgi:hypothetical protein
MAARSDAALTLTAVLAGSDTSDPFGPWQSETATDPGHEHRCRTCDPDGTGRAWPTPVEHLTWTDPDGTDRTAHIPAPVSGPSSTAMARTVARRADLEREAAAARRRASAPVWSEARRLLDSGATTPRLRSAVARARTIEHAPDAPRVAAHRGGPTRQGQKVTPDPITRVRMLPGVGREGRPPTGTGALCYRAPAPLVALLALARMWGTPLAIDTAALVPTLTPTRIVGATGRPVAKGATAYRVTMRDTTYTAPAYSGGRIGGPGQARRRPTTTPTTTTTKRPTTRRRVTRADLARTITTRTPAPALIG